MIQIAAGTGAASLAQGAAKLCCLRPSTNAVLLAKALDLAQRGLQSKKGAPGLPWYQMTLGLAEYRNGQFSRGGTDPCRRRANSGQL